MILKWLAGISIVFFLLMGIIFSVVLVHEVFHVYHMKGASAICLSMGFDVEDDLQNGTILAFTKINTSEYNNLNEFDSIREMSEKIADVLTYLAMMLIVLIIGGSIGYWLRFKEVD